MIRMMIHHRNDDRMAMLRIPIQLMSMVVNPITINLDSSTDNDGNAGNTHKFGDVLRAATTGGYQTTKAAMGRMPAKLLIFASSKSGLQEEK